MKLTLAIAVLVYSVKSISAADLDGIQNATPIGIPLNNPSYEIGGVNNGDAAQEEHHLGGYRPLYPPYFERSGNAKQQTYYDKEYYSRDAQFGNADSRLDRTLKIASHGIPTNDVEVYAVTVDSRSQPASVVRLQNQLPAPVQVPFQPHLHPPTHFPLQSKIHLQSQQYEHQFAKYRTETRSFFYNFKFPSS